MILNKRNFIVTFFFSLIFTFFISAQPQCNQIEVIKPFQTMTAPLNEVNLYEYPETIDPICNVDNASSITIGDLHANAMKLLYMMLRQGFVTLDKADFDQLFSIYLLDMQWPDDRDISQKESQLGPEDVEEFLKILNKIKVREESKETIARLIGDEIGDRAGNDFLTIFLIGRLRDIGVNIKINFSNHGLWGIYGIMSLLNGERLRDLESHFFEDINSGSVLQGGSLLRFESLYNKPGMKDLNKKFKDVFERQYLPLLELADIEGAQDSNGAAHIAYYSHGPNKWKTVVDLYPLHTMYNQLVYPKYPQHLFTTDFHNRQDFVQKINRSFVRILKGHRALNFLETLLRWPLISQFWPKNLTRVLPRREIPVAKMYSALHDLIWRRGQRVADDELLKDSPYLRTSYYGHDGSGSPSHQSLDNQHFAHCLDTVLGRPLLSSRSELNDVQGLHCHTNFSQKSNYILGYTLKSLKKL